MQRALSGDSDRPPSDKDALPHVPQGNGAGDAASRRRKGTKTLTGVFVRTMSITGRRKVQVQTDRDGERQLDLFGAGAMRTHRGFEPVCCQTAWVVPDRAKEEAGLCKTETETSRGTFDWARQKRRGSPPEDTTSTPSRVAAVANAIVQARILQAVMLTLTLAILYCADLFQVAIASSYDDYLLAVMWTCLVCFSVEWVLNVISSPAQTPRYNFSLFFFLDFIATASILIDILMFEANDLAQNGPLARAARAARIGTRAGRSMRLLRLMRFLRLVRVTKFVKVLLSLHDSQIRKRRDVETVEVVGPVSEAAKDLTRADTIGAQIGATTTRKVVIMTLLLLFVLPLLERNHNFQTCNAELVVMLQTVSQSVPAKDHCSELRKQVHDWFDTGLVPFSRATGTGLTKNGLIFAQVDRCILFQDTSLMGEGPPPPGQEYLASKRRGNEVQQIPCDAVYADTDGDQSTDSRSATYLLYDMREEEKDASRYAMGFTTVVIVLLLGFAVIFSQDAESLANELVIPIGQLMQDMSHTSRLELDQVTKEEEVFESNVYEVRKLQAAYLNLNGAVGSFAKFTPLEVVRHFLSLGTEAKLGVNQRNVSIFFSDIAGFTTICEATPPVQVLSLLSEYFESMVSIIVEEEGTMLEFIGDAILAIWNAPNSVPDHAVRAISSALRMNEALVQSRRRWMEQGKPEIRIRVGLHSADVFVGNLGSRMRMKYGVLGDGVNLASRLEELNKRYQTEILISEDVLAQPDVRESFVVRAVDYVVVKGRQKPTAIYEVLSAADTATAQCRQIAEQADEAMCAYRSRDFARALRCLEQVQLLKETPRDPAGEVLADRCRHLLRHPPPPDWDGSEVLKEKTFGPEGH